jgi:hypothetical protein
MACSTLTNFTNNFHRRDHILIDHVWVHYYQQKARVKEAITRVSEADAGCRLGWSLSARRALFLDFYSSLTGGSRSRVGKKGETTFYFKITKYGQVISPNKVIVYHISVYRCRLNTKKRFLTFAITVEERCLEGASWERHFVEFLFVIRTYMWSLFCTWCDRSFLSVQYSRSLYC